MGKATKILILGDSMGEFMGTTLDSLCLGSEIQNAAIGGTSADDWSEYSSEVLEGCEGGDWDVVYIAVGGNDVLNSGCSISADKLMSKMVSAVENIMENIAPAPKYLLTGYAMPAGTESGRTTKACAQPSDFSVLREVFLKIGEELPNNVEVIDSSFVCGGSLTSFSNPLYFQDPIHLNSKGYCEVFTQPDVQTYLSCTDPELNCKTLNFDIYGLDKHCRNTDPPNKCTDDTTWKFKGSAKKNCGWVRRKPQKLCKKKYNGVKASQACPIACKSTQCTIPGCKDDSQWTVELKNGKTKNCKYLKNKARCNLIGTDKTFGYESCERCGMCE